MFKNIVECLIAGTLFVLFMMFLGKILLSVVFGLFIVFVVVCIGAGVLWIYRVFKTLTEWCKDTK